MASSFEMSGGDALEKYLRELSKNIADGGAALNVGFPEGGTEPNGESTPMVAFINEFGRTVTVKNPHGEVAGTYYQAPRPFFRNMIEKGKGNWGPMLAALLKKHNFSSAKSMDDLGDEMKGELKESIAALMSPPLAPSTIKRKAKNSTKSVSIGGFGPDKPLIDSGTMYKAVDYWVEDEK